MHNNSTRISAAERSHYGHYGTQSLRLSKDSQHQFDQCGLCLHSLVEPMSWYVGKWLLFDSIFLIPFSDVVLACIVTKDICFASSVYFRTC